MLLSDSFLNLSNWLQCKQWTVTRSTTKTRPSEIKTNWHLLHQKNPSRGKLEDKAWSHLCWLGVSQALVGPVFKTSDAFSSRPRPWEVGVVSGSVQPAAIHAGSGVLLLRAASGYLRVRSGQGGGAVTTRTLRVKEWHQRGSTKWNKSGERNHPSEYAECLRHFFRPRKWVLCSHRHLREEDAVELERLRDGSDTDEPSRFPYSAEYMLRSYM